MIYRLKVRFFDAYDSSYTCFIKVSPFFYTLFFLHEEPISYEVLSELVSPRTLSRLKPLFWPHVIHQGDGNFITYQMFHYNVLSLKSLD